MYKSIIFFVSFLLGLSIQYVARAQSAITPPEGGLLNYRIIGFSFPQDKPETKYCLEIALGYYETDAEFLANKIVTKYATENKIIAEVPDFGAGYTWRITCNYKNEVVKKGEMHRFCTGYSKGIDSNKYRVRVITAAQKYKDAFIFTDDNHALYDMSGQPVWYLPPLNGFDNNAICRDIKLTAWGTITLILGETPLEINYSGDILWKAPNTGAVSGEETEHYHHEFTRLPNGHYMTLGSEMLQSKIAINNPYDLPVIVHGMKEQQETPGFRYNKIPFGTLIEYDLKGKIVWQWKTAGFYEHEKLYRTLKNNHPGLYDMHENGFFFDAPTHKIYLSEKQTSQILKIDYPSGTVERIYGRTDNNISGSVFSDQHNCRLISGGYLCLFNNNACSDNRAPELMIFKEPASKNEKLQKIWTYNFSSADLGMPAGSVLKGTSGGSVAELSDHELFTSVCAPFSGLFIISRNKTILFHAITARWNDVERKWEALSHYRASIIENRKDLEKAIWHH